MILARRSDLVVINKKLMRQIVDFAVPEDSKVKIRESEKLEKTGPYQRTKEIVESDDSISITFGTLGIISKNLKTTGET